jgi:hypothetical protein
VVYIVPAGDWRAGLQTMADKLGAQTTVLRSREGVTGDGRVAEVLVRRVPDDQQFLDLRVVCLVWVSAGM